MFPSKFSQGQPVYHPYMPSPVIVIHKYWSEDYKQWMYIVRERDTHIMHEDTEELFVCFKKNKQEMKKWIKLVA